MAGGGGGEGEFDVHLNLVPLIDILSNILFFLLIGFASSAVKYEGDLILPSAYIDTNADARLSVKIEPQGLLVQDIAVAKIENGQITSPVEGDKIIGLYERLNAIRLERLEKSGGITTDDDAVFIFADRKTPYTLLSPVLKTAAMAGFPNFRLAVVKK